MKILLTGASSFTGFWFAKSLSEVGHEVTATLQQAPEAYVDDLRKERVRQLATFARVYPRSSFGDERFLELLAEGGWSALCHHGADVTNYRSEDFDPAAATARNSFQIGTVLQALRRAGCSKVILTGSVFENDEGAGSGDLRAFSPYGLSKAFTWQVFRYHCARAQIALGKFVIPNPFGPWEEARFTHYLMRNWLAGSVASVNTPAYVRDNIPVSLLARAYASYCGRLPAGISKLCPSYYVETQGAFATRVAVEMRARIGRLCELDLAKQKDFNEPFCRINTDHCDPIALHWDEAKAWDDFAEYYVSRLR